LQVQVIHPTPKKSSVREEVRSLARKLWVLLSLEFCFLFDGNLKNEQRTIVESMVISSISTGSLSVSCILKTLYFLKMPHGLLSNLVQIHMKLSKLFVLYHSGMVQWIHCPHLKCCV
jgi:hypothetical protein